MFSRLALFGVAAVLAFAATASAQTPLDTRFKYQGELRLNNIVVDQVSDFNFDLFGQAAGGVSIGVNNLTNVSIARGVFEVELDFGGAAFDGDKRWLEIQVRSPAGAGVFATLSPRVELTATPYSLRSLASDVADDASALGGNAPGAYVLKGEVGTVTSAMIVDGTITSSDLGANSVGATQIAINAVGSNEIQDSSVAAVDLAPNSVGTSEIQPSSIGGTEIVDGSVTAADLAADSVGASELAINAVGTGEIQDNSITSADLATNSVGSFEIASNAVGTSEIQDNSVTSADLGTNSVGTSEIQDNSVTSADLGANSVGSSEIQDNSVTSVDLGANSVGSSEIQDNSVTSVDLGANSVGSSEIQSNAVTSIEILNGSVTAADLAAGAADGANATLLDGLDSTSFLRSNTSDTFTGAALTMVGGTTLNVDGTLDVGGGLVVQDGTTMGVLGSPATFTIGGTNLELNLGDSLGDTTTVSGPMKLNANSLHLNADGPDGDHQVYFYDGSSSTGTSLHWDDDATAEFSPCSTALITASFRWNILDNTNTGWAFSNGTDEEFVVDSAGPAYLDGSLTTGGSCDVAETFLGDADLEPGTVVRIDPSAPEAVKASDRAYDPMAIGVVSTRPGILLNGPTAGAYEVAAQMDETARLTALNPDDPELSRRMDDLEATLDSWQRGDVPVALVGRVPCLVVGAIRAGEPVTSSNVAGHAMALAEAGPSIGLALEAKAGLGKGTVLVLVQPGHRLPLPAADAEERSAVTRDGGTIDDHAVSNVAAHGGGERRTTTRTERAHVRAGADGRSGRGTREAAGQDGSDVAPDLPHAVRLTKEEWGDVDGDGKNDVLVVNPAGGGHLYRNLGDGTFEDVTATSNLGELDGIQLGLFEDYDRDQRLDLLLVDTTGAATLHQGAGTGAFQDVTKPLGLDFGQPVVDAEWLDYDEDSLPDLRVELADGRLSLFHNTGHGVFQAVPLRAAQGTGERESRITDLESEIAALKKVVERLARAEENR